MRPGAWSPASSLRCCSCDASTASRVSLHVRDAGPESGGGLTPRAEPVCGEGSVFQPALPLGHPRAEQDASHQENKVKLPERGAFAALRYDRWFHYCGTT